MMIRAEGVSKRFGRLRAVDGVSFSLDPGDALALWGTNGAGKTTLLRCVLGVIRCRGSIRVGEWTVGRHGKRARSLIGYVPQELAFHEDTRVAGALAFYARLRRITPREASEALARVGLTGHERQRVRDLSGGMKQRLALAISMLGDPPIIVLDEPTSNLDAAGRRGIVAMLQDLRSRGKSLLYASHRPEEVVDLADRVLVLDSGRVAKEASPSSLFANDAVTAVVRLIVHEDEQHRAADRLTRAGHDVSLNGHGLCVSIRSDRKAEPIALLARESIAVHDFELLHRDARGEANR